VSLLRGILSYNIAEQSEQPTRPTVIVDDHTESIDEMTDDSNDKGFFQNLGDELKRFGAYIREKVLEIIERIRNKFKQIR
jgi:hypothetical protein